MKMPLDSQAQDHDILLSRLQTFNVSDENLRRALFEAPASIGDGQDGLPSPPR